MGRKILEYKVTECWWPAPGLEVSHFENILWVQRNLWDIIHIYYLNVSHIVFSVIITFTQ